MSGVLYFNPSAQVIFGRLQGINKSNFDSGSNIFPCVLFYRVSIRLLLGACKWDKISFTLINIEYSNLINKHFHHPGPGAVEI